MYATLISAYIFMLVFLYMYCRKHIRRKHKSHQNKEQHSKIFFVHQRLKEYRPDNKKKYILYFSLLLKSSVKMFQNLFAEFFG